MWVLELSDAEVAVSRDGGVHYREPGVALLEREPVFGDAALASARLRPRQFQSQYFSRMNAEPVVPGIPGVSNQADLAYLHLLHVKSSASIGDDDELFVAVPSGSTREQLGLLLGIAREAKLNIRAVIDSAVAAASSARLPERCKLIDVLLHGATVVDLSIVENARRESVQEVPEAGLMQLLEGWVDTVADRFVGETRLDPLRIAQTEQQVFDQVCTQVLNEGGLELSVAVEHRGSERRVRLPASALAEKSGQRYDLLIRRIGAATTLALTHRASRLPGLAQRLRALGHRLILLDANAARDGIWESADSLRGDDEVAFITSLPAASEAVAPEEIPSTHILCDAVAVPLGDEFHASHHPRAAALGNAFRIVRRASGHYLAPGAETEVLLNEHVLADETRIALGDSIRCRQQEFTIVHFAGD
ncbi:MAG: hypothetical protein OXP28_18815 [Gammaproteobacteria bacterium]|nr:hypothetical protein [Gammaproteobacteria bacterium]